MTSPPSLKSFLGIFNREEMKQKIDSLSQAELSRLAKSLTPRLNKYIPIKVDPPNPKQITFLLLNDVLEICYGGAAGGGKSESLLAGAAQFVDVPGYAALLLRRRFKDLSLPGALMDRSKTWWMNSDARYTGAPNYRWVFPSGAVIQFGYLEHEGDEEQYQSAEFQYCVKYDTLVLMGDRSWKPISRIVAGESVMTMEGPQPVTRVHDVGRKPTVSITTLHGTVIASRSHPIFTPYGWASPQEQRSIQFHDGDNTDESSIPSPSRSHLLAVSQQSDLPPSQRLSRQTQMDTRLLERSSWSIDERSGSSTSDGSPREVEPPPKWFFPVVLFGPEPPSDLISLSDRGYGPTSGSSAYGVRDSSYDCQPYRGSDGERSRLISTSVQLSLPSPSDVEQLSEASHDWGGLGCIRERSRSGRLRYSHPYTNEARQISEAVHRGIAEVALGDEEDLFDLTVAGANHYVTHGNIIVKNCGFDELTQFSEKQYTYLFSRLRRPDKLKGTQLDQVPLRMRGATNPGGRGHAWVKDRFKIEMTDDGPKGVNEPEKKFIFAKLSDNPYVDQESYLKSLSYLSDVTRAQLERGDWGVQSSGGIFDTDYIAVIERSEVPERIYFMGDVRCWDLAATKPTEADPDPDYTAGLRMARVSRLPEPAHRYFADRNLEMPLPPYWIIFDVVRDRQEAGGVDELISAITRNDGARTSVFIHQERGASGKRDIAHFKQRLEGYPVHRLWVTGDKADRTRIPATMMREGRVFAVNGPYLDALFDEMGLFNPDVYKGHDDQVDAFTGAFISLERLGVVDGGGQVFQH